MIDEVTLFLIYLGYLAVLSIITFFTYASDKSRAQRNKLRVPEKVLLSMSFLGGAYGGFVAMQVFRHKTKGEHWYFTAINVVGIIIHTALLFLLANKAFELL